MHLPTPFIPLSIETRFIARLYGTLLFLLIPSLLPAQDKNCWPLFRGNPELRGISFADIPSSPELLWVYKAADGIKAPVVVCEDIIITGSVNGTVYALDLKGEPLWKFETGNGIEAPALINMDMVYIGNLEGTLFALNLHTGKEIWQYKTGGQIMGSPNIFRSGTASYIITGSYDYYLHCVDAKTGAFKWKYESDNFIHGAASITDNLAVFGGCDGFLHLVNVHTGKLQNKIDIATYIASSATTGGGYAYVGDYDGQFSCVSLKEKKVAWTFISEDSQLPFIGSPSLYKNVVIAGSRDRHVYCLNKNTGSLVWKYNAGSRVDASPVIVNDKVLIANMRGDFLIVDVNTGKRIWSYELGIPLSSNPAVIENKIILAADDGRIYCFGKK